MYFTHTSCDISVEQILNVLNKLNLLGRCVSRHVSFAVTHTAMPPFIFALIIRVHPAALTVRVHEVPRPVRVRSQGGWVRNGIKVDWI